VCIRWQSRGLYATFTAPLPAATVAQLVERWARTPKVHGSIVVGVNFFYFFIKSRASRFLRFRSTEMPIIDYFAKSEAEPVSNVHTVLRKKSMKPRKLSKGKLKWLNFTRKKLHNFTEYAKTIPKKSQVFLLFCLGSGNAKKHPF
jgi:hypothetical protein